MDSFKIIQFSFVEPLSDNVVMNGAKLVDHYDGVWRVP